MWEEKEGRIVGRKYEEMIDDFVSMHKVDLMSSVAVIGEGERNVVMEEDGCHAARWNLVWEVIPSTRSSVLDFGTASNPSLVTIVCICLHYKESHKTHLASCSDEESHKAHLMLILARLIVATLDQCAMLLNKKEEYRKTGNRLSTGDKRSSGEEYESKQPANKSSYISKDTVLLHMAIFLVSKLTSVVAKCHRSEVVFNFVKSKDLIAVIDTCVKASSTDHRDVSLPDLKMLKASLSLVSKVMNHLVGEAYDSARRNLLASVFAMLARSLIQERKSLPHLMRSKHNGGGGRSEHQKICVSCAERISTIALEIAGILSNNPCTLKDGDVKESFVVAKLTFGIAEKRDSPSDRPIVVFPLAMLSESLAWFWSVVSSSDAIESTTASSMLTTTSSVHKRVANCLVIPICAAVVSFCHAASHGQNSPVVQSILCFEARQTKDISEAFSLSDYFYSDDSAKDCGQVDGSGDESGDEKDDGLATRRYTLRLLCRTVKYFSLVFSQLCDKKISSIYQCILSLTPEGFFLPKLRYCLRIKRLMTLSPFKILFLKGMLNMHAVNWKTTYVIGFRNVSSTISR